MNRLVTVFVAASILLFLSCSDADLTAPDLASEASALAKKGGNPGGGGPGGEPMPAGKIYAYLSGDRVELDGDGTVLNILSADAKGSPSHELHGGKRWFLFTEEVAGFYPDSTERRALVAASESGVRVVLINDPLFHPRGNEARNQPRWSPAPADGQIAFVGRRFASSLAAASEGGVYVVNVSFATGTPTLNADSVSLRIEGSMIEDPTQCTIDGICYATSDVSQPEWSPNGTRLAYVHRDPYSNPWLSESSLYVEEAESPQFVANNAYDPRWSTQDKILFWRPLVKSTAWTQLVSVSSDGSAESVLVTLRDANYRGLGIQPRSFMGYFWSPDGAHFVYAWFSCFSSGCDAIELVRRKADGSGETVLARPTWAVAQGWR